MDQLRGGDVVKFLGRRSQRQLSGVVLTKDFGVPDFYYIYWPFSEETFRVHRASLRKIGHVDLPDVEFIKGGYYPDLEVLEDAYEEDRARRRLVLEKGSPETVSEEFGDFDSVVNFFREELS